MKHMQHAHATALEEVLSPPTHAIPYMWLCVSTQLIDRSRREKFACRLAICCKSELHIEPLYCDTHHMLPCKDEGLVGPPPSIHPSQGALWMNMVEWKDDIGPRCQ